MKKILLLCLCYMIPIGLLAQDPHFSQYFASPLSLNPANTGYFDGDLRVAINERQQWWTVGYNYNTASLSADAKILSSYIPDNDVLAIGFSGIFDRTLNGALSSNYISISGAYHKSLADQKTQVLTVGFQFTYANRHIDYSRLTFASQFDGNGFDLTIPVLVNSNNSSTNYFDAHAGILYSAIIQKTKIYAGTSLYHIARPVESIFTPSGSRVPLRATFHTGGDIYINPSSSILFSGMYMAQANARDEMVGVAYGIKNHNYTSTFNLYLGLWLRVNDSYIPYLGFDYQNFSLGLNYSLPYSSNLNYRPSALEVSLIFRRNAAMSDFCPRF